MRSDDYSRGLSVLTRKAPPLPASNRLSRVTIGTAGRTVPSMPRKGIFERQASVYAHVEGGFVGYAVSLRCDSVILLLRLLTPQKLAQAFAAGLKVWLYAGPDDWYTSNWSETRVEIKAACLGDHRINGYVANVERSAPPPTGIPEGRVRSDYWDRATDAQVAALAAALEEDAATLSVGFCSIPQWPHFTAVARLAPHVWGSPQLYGIHSPGTPPQLLARGRPWQAVFPGYCPCLAAWARNAHEQRAYLQGMSSLPNIMFWHTQVATNDTFAALRDFVPGVGQRSGWRAVLAALGIGVAGGLITWAITNDS